MREDNEGSWKIVGASVQGVSHVKNGVPCQDNWHGAIRENILAAAVADGAGSAAYAYDGAMLASTSAVESTMRPFNVGNNDWKLQSSIEKVFHHALQSAREALIAYGDTIPVEVRELAATLLCVIAGSDFVAVAQIGDGAVVVGDEDGNVFALTKPQNGEHANETVFLTSPNAVENAEIVVWRGKVKHIAVFTDGLQRLALQMPEGAAHTPFFKPLFAFVENMTDEAQAQTELENFLRSPRIAERTDDDVTLLLAHLSRG